MANKIGFDISNPSSYIQVPQHNAVISAREAFKGSCLDFNQSLKAPAEVSSNILWMSNMPIFTTHFLNVRAAAKGERDLYDGAGKKLSLMQANQHWEYLSTGAGGICASWLDASFEEIKGKMHVNTNHRIKQLKDRKKISYEPISLSPHKHIGLVSLEFNKNGLATSLSTLNRYKQGENIYAYPPVDGSVAGFIANSGRAGLYCSRNPSFSDSNLGVFACAQKNLIGKLLK